MKQAKQKSKASPIPSTTDLNIPPDTLLEYAICLYGTKGIGKSTLSSSIPGSVTIMTEPLRKNLNIRMIPLHIHTSEEIMDGKEYTFEIGGNSFTYVDAWKFFEEELVDALIEDDSVSCINIDTVDRMYEACLSSVCTENGVMHPGGLNDFGNMWGRVKSRFEAVLNKIKIGGKGIVFISHAKEDDVELDTGGKSKMYAPTCSGQALNYIKAVADYVFFYGYHGKRRHLHFRGFDNIWTSCGPPDRFISPSGKKLELIDMEGERWNKVEQAFQNKIYDAYESGEESPKKKVKKV